jgi:hypothetical protein
MSIEIRSFELKEKKTNFPTPKQFRVENNPSYASSLVTGCFSPLLHLPQILFYGTLWPIATSLSKSFAFIALSMWAGVTGRACGYRTVEYIERKQRQAERQEVLNEMLAGTGFRAVPITAETSQDKSQGTN